MDWNLTVVFDDDTKNAFVLPDGSIFVYSGIMGEVGGAVRNRTLRDAAHKQEIEHATKRAMRDWERAHPLPPVDDVDEKSTDAQRLAREEALRQRQANRDRRDAFVEEQLLKAKRRIQEVGGFRGDDKVALVIGTDCAPSCAMAASACRSTTRSR